MLQVFKQVSPITSRPYRIVESFETIDGTRSRLSHRSFSELAEALAFCSERENTPEFEVQL